MALPLPTLSKAEQRVFDRIIRRAIPGAATVSAKTRLAFLEGGAHAAAVGAQTAATAADLLDHGKRLLDRGRDAMAASVPGPTDFHVGREWKTPHRILLYNQRKLRRVPGVVGYTV